MRIECWIQNQPTRVYTLSRSAVSKLSSKFKMNCWLNFNHGKELFMWKFNSRKTIIYFIYVSAKTPSSIIGKLFKVFSKRRNFLLIGEASSSQSHMTLPASLSLSLVFHHQKLKLITLTEQLNFPPRPCMTKLSKVQQISNHFHSLTAALTCVSWISCDDVTKKWLLGILRSHEIKDTSHSPPWSESERDVCLWEELSADFSHSREQSAESERKKSLKLRVEDFFPSAIHTNELYSWNGMLRENKRESKSHERESFKVLPLHAKEQFCFNRDKLLFLLLLFFVLNHQKSVIKRAKMYILRGDDCVKYEWPIGWESEKFSSRTINICEQASAVRHLRAAYWTLIHFLSAQTNPAYAQAHREYCRKLSPLIELFVES